MNRPIHLEADVLVIGAGAAGMSAAIAAHDLGAAVILIDRSLIGRGGATVMAQMTVAAAVGEEVPDTPEHHLSDTLKAGRGLCDEKLAALLCEEAPAAIRQMDDWHVGWARHGDGRMRQTEAPGHDRPRCVYVDYLNTGPAVSRTLRAQVQRRASVRRIGDVVITDILRHDGVACGAAGFALDSGEALTIAAKAVIIAAGGLTRLYRRNSASANMGGDGYALALRAGAELIDMEFVQFFPIGHLAPRLVGMDPIMWDPFRYKLGGRLLNSEGHELLADYDSQETGRYRVPRDVATYGILKEVAAGRGSPAGGVYLSFRHVPEKDLRQAFGPVIDRLLANGIDLTKSAVEVSPIAHYHMGGIRVAADMHSSVPGLFAAGEAVGGANGANRLSGNAIPEALVFGRRAGISAAALARKTAASAFRSSAAAAAIELLQSDDAAAALSAGAIRELQDAMQQYAGPLRDEDGLRTAILEITRLRSEHPERPPPAAGFAAARRDWFDLRNMLLVAECVAAAALARRESRGAHQREDFPATDATCEASHAQTWRHGRIGAAPAAVDVRAP
ncbi:MAG TPA: FAD-binding protein [Micropepsaceae bacterium]|nr:FAD-binding protein [Micropepsaceae bacterium]